MRTVPRLLLLLLTMPWNSFSQPVDPVIKTTSAQAVIFAGSTPCGRAARPLNNIPETTRCDVIKWELRLNFDSLNRPVNFILNSQYIFYVNNRDFQVGGVNNNISGSVEVQKGTTDNPDAVVYRLKTTKTELLLLRLDDNLLHPLNENRSLMVGTSGWSYTLSRKQN